jgi:MFS family permease
MIGLGAVNGVFLLNAEFARGTLGASRWHILALLLVPALAQTLVVVRNPVDPRRGWIRHPFRRLAVPVHLLLLLPLLGLLPAAPLPFVLLLATCSAVQMLLVPVQNGLLAGNYARATRGRRFGAANAVNALALVAVALPAGWLLDRWAGSWRWLYALAGVAGVTGYLHWSRLRRRRVVRAAPTVREHASPWEALRRDPLFLAFEACFMAYGLGFLMLMPVLPIYLIDELEVSYAEVSYAKGALFWIVMVLTGPLLGRVSDRIGILRLNVLAFLTLALFPAALIALDGTLGMYVGYAIFGLAMSGVFLGWTLGPIHLAGDRDPAPYLDAHLGLVGIRSVVGMTAGVWIQQQLGTHAVLWCVIVLEIVAALGMVCVARRARTQGAD